MTQGELHAQLLSQGLKCCKRTVFSALRQCQYTRKRAKRTRQSKNATAASKAAFKQKFISILDDGGDVIFQDESHFSHNVLPLYGYSKRGKPCYVVEAAERKAHTLLFAFSKSGQVFYKVYEGSGNTPRMQWFVDHLPPTRVLMDNHTIHKGVKMDVEKVFTPVAQPYANPAEIVFSKIKTLFRKFNSLDRDASVEEKIDRAIAQLTDADLAGAIVHVRNFVESTY
jgi:transposase